MAGKRKLKLKCIRSDEPTSFTVGKIYPVAEVQNGFHNSGDGSGIRYSCCGNSSDYYYSLPLEGMIWDFVIV